MESRPSSGFVAGVKRGSVGEMDFFETEMRKEKRDRKELAGAGDDDGLGIKNGDDLTIDVRDIEFLSNFASHCIDLR